MKKFTKGCLTTALILFLVGCVICGVCGLLGGFRQIKEMDGVRGIPFGYYSDAGSGWQVGFIDNGKIGKDWEKERYLRIEEGKGNEISFQAASCDGLDLELASCSLHLEESADDQIRVYVEGDTLRYYWMLDGKTLCLRNAGRRASHMRDEIHLRIPKGHMFDEVEVEFGAGLLKADPLLAKEVFLDVGAGACEMQEIDGELVVATVGAGSLLINGLYAESASLQTGAGDLTVRDIWVSDSSNLSMSMGTAEINGTIEGDFDLDCGMGDVTMKLTGSEEDHSYDVECGMGNVQVGNHSHGGFASSRSWNSGKESHFDIECSMGSVEISFEE